MRITAFLAVCFTSHLTVGEVCFMLVLLLHGRIVRGIRYCRHVLIIGDVWRESI